jgi:hypothetical protein
LFIGKISYNKGSAHEQEDKAWLTPRLPVRKPYF